MTGRKTHTRFKFIKIIFTNLIKQETCFWNPWKSSTVPNGSAGHRFNITDLTDITIQFLHQSKHIDPNFNIVHNVHRVLRYPFVYQLSCTTLFLRSHISYCSYAFWCFLAHQKIKQIVNSDTSGNLRKEQIYKLKWIQHKFRLHRLVIARADKHRNT